MGLQYEISRETEKAFLIEFNAYKGVKEEVIKLNTWIPKIWVSNNNICSIERNMKSAIEEKKTSLNKWMLSKGYYSNVKINLYKKRVEKPKYKSVENYIYHDFFIEERKKYNDTIKLYYDIDWTDKKRKHGYNFTIFDIIEKFEFGYFIRKYTHSKEIASGLYFYDFKSEQELSDFIKKYPQVLTDNKECLVYKKGMFKIYKRAKKEWKGDMASNTTYIKI